MPVLLALLTAAAPAAATPIPEGPDGNPPPAFFGSPAIQHPITVKPIPRHPFMAPNDRSNLHNDAYQTDANRGPGPLGRAMRRLSTFQSADCASITFDRRGRLVTVCVGLFRPTLYMFDPKTLDTLASMTLPPRQPDPGGRIFNDFAGGGYFYMDNHDRAVVLTNSKHLYVIRETAAPGFEIQRDYDLSSAFTPLDKGFSALPDWTGRYWFVTSSGVVGTVDPASGKLRSMKLPNGEDVQNSFSVDEDGGVYIVSSGALYRFDAGPVGEPKITWRAVYPNSGIHKPGQADAGSGTTPTIMEHGLVAITDNDDPMNIVVYRRGKSVAGSRLVCEQPVFEKGASATDNSLNVAGRAMVVENNYGYSGPDATEQGKTTTPGIERVDVKPDLSGCTHVWTSNEIAPTVVPKISLANGLVYAYTKPGSDDGSDYWYLTAIDFRTGRTVYRFRAGEGLGYNNNYAPITIGPDNGAVYIGVLGGLVMLRDVTPPPRHPGAAGKRKPRLWLTLRYRAKHRRCAIGRVRARVNGRDSRRIALVRFLVGAKRVARDRTPPYVRRIRLRRTSHDRIYLIRARVRLVDGRKLTLRRDVRACAAGHHGA
ncbi:MAG: hypothetical protein QOJ14_670 [Thermoleophilaceae bacterium]|nr:hypothetical protein [Thermoleophilaceae bacterium]